MSVRDEVDRHLVSDDLEGVKEAVRVLADAVEVLGAGLAKAERLQRLAEQGFEQGVRNPSPR